MTFKSLLAATFVACASLSALPAIASVTPVSFTATLTATAAGDDAIQLSRRGRGSDDGAGHQRRCRGCDDGANHASSPLRDGENLARRGADDPAGDNRHGGGKDDPVGHG